MCVDETHPHFFAGKKEPIGDFDSLKRENENDMFFSCGGVGEYVYYRTTWYNYCTRSTGNKIGKMYKGQTD